MSCHAITCIEKCHYWFGSELLGLTQPLTSRVPHMIYTHLFMYVYNFIVILIIFN